MYSQCLEKIHDLDGIFVGLHNLAGPYKCKIQVSRIMVNGTTTGKPARYLDLLVLYEFEIYFGPYILMLTDHD